MSDNTSFTLAREAAKNDEFPPVDFTFTLPAESEDEDDEVVTLTANYPGDGVLMMAIGEANENTAGAVTDLIRESMSPKDYRTLRGWIREGTLPPEALPQIAETMIEKWSGFPTQRSSGSRQQRRASGERSTGRVRSGG